MDWPSERQPYRANYNALYPVGKRRRDCFAQDVVTAVHIGIDEVSISGAIQAAPLWPRLPVALGYNGGARWVAFYISADKVHFHDGSSFGMGDTSLFLAYKRHPLIAPSLAGVPLGSADEDPREWLLVDQAERLLYLAAPETARRHLAEQWPRSTKALEYTPEELARLLADLEETAPPADWAERLTEALRERRANERLMIAWLDACSGGGISH